MKKTGVYTVFVCLLFFPLIAAILASGCSKDLPAYEELVESGNLETAVRKQHASFFKTISDFEKAVISSGESEPDSTELKKAAAATDIVVEKMKPFPSTVESRIALDALSYAAGDLSTEENMNDPFLTNFRDSALLLPIFSIGKTLAASGDINDSAHLQLIKTLRLGMGAYATEEMLVNCLTIVGVTPSDAVLQACEEDTLVFKRVHDLLLYSRSLQKTDPPLWLLSGAWFTAIQFEESPAIFLSLVPRMVGDIPFLAFRDYTQGEVYAAVYDDPIPREKEKWSAWLARGNAIMNSLTFDTSFADRVKDCDLPTYDAHHFFDEYILHAFADTVKMEFMISLTKSRVEESAFNFTGMDSVTVTFSGMKAIEPDPGVTVLPASRTIGNSMRGEQFYPGKSLTGKAYMMPMGEHTQTYIEEYKRKFMPEIVVNKVPAEN